MRVTSACGACYFSLTSFIVGTINDVLGNSNCTCRVPSLIGGDCSIGGAICVRV